ncbi:MAG TPA: hypothetical protein ENJ37_02655 [Deltaproteobacteria bacterium]|nr:hypothetical protein [Deltaproteobacteria bacterium]
MFYKVIVEHGHMGSGKGCEITRYIKGTDPVNAMLRARSKPRVKRRDTMLSIKLLEEITEDEYRRGRRRFRELCAASPYFNS